MFLNLNGCSNIEIRLLFFLYELVLIMKVRCDIEGLDCPHCALTLTKMLAKDDAIESADINFPMKSLVMEVADDADEEEILARAQKIGKEFDDSIEIDLRD